MLLTWSTVIASAGSILLALTIFIKAKRTAENIYFALMAIFVGLICTSNYFSITSTYLEKATLFWIRAVMAFVPWIMVFLYQFSLSYKNIRYRPKTIRDLALYAVAFIVTIINVSPLTYSGVSFDESGSIVPRTGPGLIIFGLFLLPLFIASIYNMLKNAKKAEPSESQRIKITLSLFLFSFGIQIITSFVIVALFHYTNLVFLGNFLMFLFVVTVTASILNYKILELNVFTSVIFVAILALLIFADIFSAPNFQGVIYKIIVFLAILYIGYRFIKSIILEIKERKRVERLAERLRVANEKLKELDRLKSEFLSMASHQLRTPLSIIKGYLHTLQTGKVGEISDKQKHFVKTALDANEQLIAIIDDFLNLGRIEEKRIKVEFEEVDLPEIVATVLQRMGSLAIRKEINLKFEKPETFPKITADRAKLVEVLTNIVDNSIKYGKDRGWVKIKLKKEGTRIKIIESDNGIGIPDDFKSKLFSKFNRAPNAVKAVPSGNGIGLYLVKKIIDLHHGEVKIESEEGKGTKFVIELPIHQKEIHQKEIHQK